MNDHAWPISILRAEIAEILEADDRESDKDNAEMAIFRLLTQTPDLQLGSRKIAEDVDWMISDEAPLSRGMQASLVRGVVTGIAAVRRPKPRAFIRDVSRSVDEMVAEGLVVGAKSQKELTTFARWLHKGRRGTLVPGRVDEQKLVRVSSRLDVDPMRIVDAWYSLSKSGASGPLPALIQGAPDDDWASLRERVENAVAETLGTEGSE